MLYFIIVGIHIVLCLLVLFAMIFRRLSVPKYMFIIAVLLPFWGILIVLIQHFKIGFDSDSAAELDVEKFKVESELYRSVTVDDKRSDKTIPIEEALLINTAKERRALIMDVLNDNPSEYVDLLQKAGNNEDTEVVHYAVTAMVEISKETDAALQRLSSAYEAAPDDINVLVEYADFLWDRLSKNIMQGQVEVLNREIFSQLMHKKIATNPDVADYTRLIENELIRKHWNAAEDALHDMAEQWEQTEEYVLLNVQYLSCMNKGDELRDFIKKAENSNIYLSSKTKEVLAFWAN